MQREESPTMETGLERIAAKSSERTKTPVYVTGPSRHARKSLGESMSDSEGLISRGGWSERTGGERELWGMD